MNASYNKSFEEASASANQGVRANGYSFVSFIIALLGTVAAIVKSKVFRAITVTACFFIALGVVGGIETGALTFGTALLILVPIALVEWLCLRKN